MSALSILTLGRPGRRNPPDTPRRPVHKPKEATTENLKQACLGFFFFRRRVRLRLGNVGLGNY